jgi:hypothetical protein
MGIDILPVLRNGFKASSSRWQAGPLYLICGFETTSIEIAWAQSTS